MNVQMVCLADQYISHVNAMSPGSVHDAYILRNSSIPYVMGQLQRHRVWLLGDSGYPNLSWLLTPVRNPRTRSEERYNEAHGRTRRVIEQTFGLLKARGWGAGVVVLWRGVLSTSASGGGGQFIVHASVRGPLQCHSVRPGVEYFFQHPYDGTQGGADGSEFLPEAHILFLLQALGLLKLGQYRLHRLLGVVVGSHDGGEGLVESGFPWPIRPLSHSNPPSSPVFLGLRPLDRVPTATAPRSLLLLVWWVSLCSL
ncbi:hypothetical protein NDU88_004046 [Pleurodeles waltl]|uniref:DDE Tnp4 domain-containing protein n=1 Tax=Pleurodeles waltl TaxID=8319 RepID=A0AAV7WX13_PLEWA|nr:hypothetical protein NDU88_004046 [Pleurodeles waltl]